MTKSDMLMLRSYVNDILCLDIIRVLGYFSSIKLSFEIKKNSRCATSSTPKWTTWLLHHTRSESNKQFWGWRTRKSKSSRIEPKIWLIDMPGGRWSGRRKSGEMNVIFFSSIKIALGKERSTSSSKLAHWFMMLWRRSGIRLINLFKN